MGRQGVHWLLVNRGLQSESMRRRRVATGDPMKLNVLKFEQDLIDRVELVRLEMERRRPGDRTAWPRAMLTLLDEALTGEGELGRGARSQLYWTRKASRV